MSSQMPEPGLGQQTLDQVPQLNLQPSAQGLNPLQSGAQSQTQVPEYPVNSFDNHAVHIAYHNRFRKSQQFEMLSDTAKEVFEKHVQAHQLAMQAGAQPQDTSSMYEDQVVVPQQQPAQQPAQQQRMVIPQ